MNSVQFDTERLRHDAAAQGLTLSALAKRAKVSPQGVTLFIQGRTRSPKMAGKLAKVLGYPVKRYLVPLPRAGAA